MGGWEGYGCILSTICLWHTEGCRIACCLMTQQLVVEYHVLWVVEVEVLRASGTNTVIIVALTANITVMVMVGVVTVDWLRADGCYHCLGY